MDQKKKAVIYCRVSTKEQVEEGNSLNTQEKICKDYAVKYGYEISQVFIELGESAKTADRTQLKKLLAFCTSKKEKINALIVYRIDRLSRQMEDYTVIKSKLKQSGVEIKSTAEYFEDNPAGRFMENIIANVAQFDNDVRTERSVNGMRDAVREGRYVWMAPFGYSNTKLDNKPNIMPNQSAAIVKEAYSMVATGTPVEHVRKILVNKYAENKQVRIPSKSRFPSVFRNELYCGWINKFGERHKGSFKPIITESFFLEVQNVLDERKIIKGKYTVLNPDFPLRKYFSHPSGIKLTGGWSKGKNKKYAYYFFRLPNSNFPKDQVEDKFLSLLDSYKLQGHHIDKLVKEMQGYFEKHIENNGKNKMVLSNQISQLKQKQHLLVQKNLAGTLPDNILKQELETLEKEIFELENLLQEPNEKKIDSENLLAFIREYVEHPAETWKKAYSQGKIILQWLYFPKGVIFDGIECRTPETCLIFRLKEIFDQYSSRLVNYPNSKSNTPQIPQLPYCDKNDEIEYALFWKNLNEELLKLSEIKEKCGGNGPISENV